MKTKKWFTSVLALSLLVGVICVSAGSNSAQFGVGDSSGTAYVSAGNGEAYASTTPTYSNANVITKVRVCGVYGNSAWASGEYSAAQYAVAASTKAESQHSINGIWESLWCSYN